MIINFSIKNYRSFRNKTTLSLEAENLYNHSGIALFDSLSDCRVLPVAGIFGPNASGKSNILRALFYFRQAVISSDQVNLPITAHPDLKPFRLDGNTEPISFEIEILSRDRKKEYTFSFSILQEKIIEERFEVLERLKKNRRTYTIYERKRNRIDFPDASIENELAKFGNVLSLDDGILTINRLANLIRFSYAEDFLEEIKNIVIINEGYQLTTSNGAYLAKLYNDENLRKRVFRILYESDFCIKDLEIHAQDMPDSIRHQILGRERVPDSIKEALRANKTAFKSYDIKSLHKRYDNHKGDYEFDFTADESSGTQKMLFYAQIIVDAIRNGRTVVIDELGQGLHPFLAGKIVRTFLDDDTNTKGAQLVFNSHETYLLSRDINMYNDQIYFADKDNNERSVLTSLSEFKERNDAATVKRYLSGRLGGIPNLMDGGFDVDG